jgi:hypothetical protein
LALGITRKAAVGAANVPGHAIAAGGTIGPARTEDPAIVANANAENASPAIIADLQIVFIVLSNIGFCSVPK